MTLLQCPCNGRYGGDPYFYHNNNTKNPATGQLCSTDAFGNTSHPCKEKRATPCDEHGIMGNGCDKPFKKDCVSHDSTLGKDGKQSGDLLAQNNPTCNGFGYQGGLSCCSHGRIMLDADQTKHDDGPLLKYHMKFRFWYSEYKPEGPPVSKGVAALSNASHIDLPRIYWQTEANAGEYDIPPAFFVEGKVLPFPISHAAARCAAICHQSCQAVTAACCRAL